MTIGVAGEILAQLKESGMMPKLRAAHHSRPSVRRRFALELAAAGFPKSSAGLGIWKKSTGFRHDRRR